MLINESKELKDSNKILQAVFDSAPNGIAVMENIYDEEGRVEDFAILLFNAYTVNWIGDLDYKGKRYGDLFPMVKENGILERFIQVAETGSNANFERWYNGDGMNHFFRFTAVKQGELLVVTTEDITAERKAEAALNESDISNQKQRRLYEAVTNNTPDLVYVFDLDYRFSYANKALLTMWGKSWEESIGRGLRELGYEEWHAQMHEREIDEIVKTKKSIRGTVSFPHAELGRRVYDYIFAPVFNEHGEVEAIAGTTRDITEIKQVEDAIRESESRFRLMADTIPEIIWVTNAVGETEFFNKRWTEFSGAPYEPSNAAEVAERFVHPDDVPAVMHAFEEAIKNGSAMEVEQRNRSASGQWCWFLNRAMPYRNPQTGEVERWFGISTDIHDQKATQQALAESESRFRALVNASSDVVYRLNADWSIMYPLDGRGFLLDAHAPVEGWMEINVHHSEFERVKEAIATAIENKTVFALEHKVVTVTGATGWTFSRAVPILDDKGNILEWFGTATDITARKNIEQSLKESEERFRSMADASPVMIWTLDESGNSTYYNTRAAEFTGHSENDLREGKSWQVSIHPDDIENATSVVQNAVANRIPYEMECRMQRADGSWRWLMNRGIPRFGEDGNYFGFVGSSVDITEHKNSEQALQTALEQMRLSKEAAELGTFDMDLEKGTMHWDDRCRILFGISHHDAVSYEHDFVNGLHPADRERITKLIDRLFDRSISNGEYDVEYRTVGAEDGVVRWVRAKGKVYFNTQQKPVRFIGSVLDITEKVTALQRVEGLVEERTKELAHANETLQKINKELQRSNQNLEEFAHAASHDLKEPVRKIHFFTAQLKDQLKQQLSESQSKAFTRIENASQRMGNLIDDLLLYSHVSQRPHEQENVDLNLKVRNTLEDLELDIAERNAVIDMKKLPFVKGYRRQLQQLFQNLVSNAIKYSKADEPPRIEISAEEAVEGGTSYHVIIVKDNGIGIPEEYVEKIFQMFTRLHGKDEYSGTGVGLSIVKKVVENHNGFIRVESEVGRGSAFRIYLPA